MKKPKILTRAQALELKWFCQNVVGVRKDMYSMYETLNKFKSFDDRIKRLEKTCSIIEKYLGEPIEPFASPWINE